MKNTDLKIFVAGHQGMVGSALVRELNRRGYQNIVTRTHQELDLIDQSVVRDFFQIEKPDQVFLAAAKVGGIYANNTYPAEFIRENLAIQTNVIHESYRAGTKKLLFLGSSCIYPRVAPQPIDERQLLIGPMELTNEPYAIAKIAGIKMCESYNRQYASEGIDFRAVMPSNLYGPGDSYHPQNSHVIPGLIHKLHHGKQRSLPSVTLWGTGKAMREFLYVDDMASACVHVMNLERSVVDNVTEPQCSHINIGYGYDLTIKDLAAKVANVIGYTGDIKYDAGKPDGTPKKLLNSNLLRSTGWEPRVSLEQGLELTYADYLSHVIQKIR